MAENGTGHPQKRKYTRRQIKRSAVVKMLNAASERLRKSSRDQNSVMFKNPFQGLTGNEDLQKLRKKLGEEKFEMAIQMYNYFEDVLAKVATENDGQIISTGDEQTNHLIDQLQSEVYELRNHLMVLEKMNGVNPDVSLFLDC